MIYVIVGFFRRRFGHHSRMCRDDWSVRNLGIWVLSSIVERLACNVYSDCMIEETLTVRSFQK